MEINQNSKNILKVLDSIYYPTQFNFSMWEIPIMNTDYTEVLDKEFGVIYGKFEEEYYAARNRESIDFFFNRYHRKIKKLLLDLEDDIYDVICTQIVRPRFHPEIYVNNLYKLHEVTFVLCKDFEREFGEVLDEKIIGNGFTTKIMYIPMESFKYAHKDFISKYKPDCEYVETGGIKVCITDKLLKDFNARHEDPDDSMLLDLAMEEINNVKSKFGPTQTDNPLRTYFKGLLWDYVHGNISKAEKALIKKAVHFIRSKIEKNNLETGVVTLDYLAFFIHTGIGGDNTHGFAIHYFTERNIEIKELKALLKVLNNLAISKEYSPYSISYIKPQAGNMKYEIIDFLEERLFALEEDKDEVNNTLVSEEKHFKKIITTIGRKELAMLIELMYQTGIFTKNKTNTSKVISSVIQIQGSSDIIAETLYNEFTGWTNKDGRKGEVKNALDSLLKKLQEMVKLLIKYS